MYISEIIFKNFRCFKNNSILFNEGLNVIIGENNAGKTTILKAIELIFNTSKSRRLSVDDFYQGLSYDKDCPPEIDIQVKIRSSGENDQKDDLAVVATWITQLEDPWEATLSYKYFLPEKDAEDFRTEYNQVKSDENYKLKFWDLLERYIPKYVYRIYAGNPELKNQVENEYLNKFNCEYLDALRDVENELFAGRKTILKNTINYYLDYNLRKLEKNSELESERNEFQNIAKNLLSNIEGRIETKDIHNALDFTGALKGGSPKLVGNLTEEDIFTALELIITNKQNYEIPISYNGLGYCNLMYISLILSKMKILSSEDYGTNATVYPILLLEEPEAHLHPALQYLFLCSLLEEGVNQKKIRQIFVTSHSTHLTSAVDLDSIICMTIDESDNINAAYPGKVFSEDDIESKHYIERYLDATKSSLLFAKSVIFVEGISEKLLIPIFAEFLDRSLERSLVCVVDVGGKTFKHFIKLFGAGIPEDIKKYALNRKVACITDTDPSRKEKNMTNARFKSCYPFELDLDPDKYEYRPSASHINNLEEQIEGCSNVKIFYKNDGGKTLEYDLAYDNPESEILCTKNSFLEDSDEIKGAINRCNWDSEDKKRAESAVFYIKNISKGENAFILSHKLKQMMNLSEIEEFVIPEHIMNAILWACDNGAD